MSSGCMRERESECLELWHATIVEKFFFQFFFIFSLCWKNENLVVILLNMIYVEWLKWRTSCWRSLCDSWEKILLSWEFNNLKHMLRLHNDSKNLIWWKLARILQWLFLKLNNFHEMNFELRKFIHQNQRQNEYLLKIFNFLSFLIRFNVSTLKAFL